MLTVDSFKVAAGTSRGRRLRPVRLCGGGRELQPGVRSPAAIPRSGDSDARRWTAGFLTDTEWPAIIGEAGFLGALAFALGLAGIYRAGVRLWATGPTPIIRWAGLTSAAWLVAGLVQSVATVTFTGPPIYGLLFGLAGVVAALSDPVHRDAAPVRAGRRPTGEPVAGVEHAVGVPFEELPVDVVVVGEHDDDVGLPRRPRACTRPAARRRDLVHGDQRIHRAQLRAEVRPAGAPPRSRGTRGRLRSCACRSGRRAGPCCR